MRGLDSLIIETISSSWSPAVLCWLIRRIRSPGWMHPALKIDSNSSMSYKNPAEWIRLKFTCRRGCWIRRWERRVLRDLDFAPRPIRNCRGNQSATWRTPTADGWAWLRTGRRMPKWATSSCNWPQQPKTTMPSMTFPYERTPMTRSFQLAAWPGSFYSGRKSVYVWPRCCCCCCCWMAVGWAEAAASAGCLRCRCPDAGGRTMARWSSWQHRRNNCGVTVWLLGHSSLHYPSGIRQQPGSDRQRGAPHICPTVQSSLSIYRLWL